MDTITVKTHPEYKIYIGENILENSHFIDLCQRLKHHIVIITDDNLYALYALPLKTYLGSHGLNISVISIPSGEKFKSRETKYFIEDKLFELGCGRDTCIIALGGGVITDLAGFVAATYCRGIPVIYLPTTLLAMLDASIGGKTSVNTSFGKNMIGTFTQPKAVFIDVNTLSTLPDSEYLFAFVEAIKHALIYDSQFFDLLYSNVEKIKKRDKSLLTEIIRKSCDIKSKIVETDEKETGMRSLLNFGHTIGHALELMSEYSMSHGQAVAMGSIVESYLSFKLGLLKNDDFQKIKNIFQDYGVLLPIDMDITADHLKKSMILDKKSKNKIPHFVLLNKIGEAHLPKSGYTSSVSEETLDQAVTFLNENFRKKR